MKKKYIIGIDTGGTYTDAVLVDSSTSSVIHSVKRPTTHFQLATGVGNSLSALLDSTSITSDEIESIGLSTTLATNSVVEDKGARVAVIVIGYVKHFKLPVKAVLFVKGGHTISGKEEEDLDIDYIVELIHNLQNEVDAYAVCSAMSIKNPAHELVTEKAISLIDPKPVFSSHRISELSGMEQRAATAGLHAKLMPIMNSFLEGIKKPIQKQGLDCSIKIIGGNGKPISLSKVSEEAGLTVASGPACTAHFGAHSTTSNDCLVIDIGGTTTDISIIKDGQPVLASQGCQIGRWKTFIEAIDMQTFGIGGDSHVQSLQSDCFEIGPGRVVPLSMTENLLSPKEWLTNSSKIIAVQKEAREELIQYHENELTSLLLQHNLVPIEFIKEQTGLSGVPLDKELEKLSRKHMITECGFTPTDALHVLRRLSIGHKDQAFEGAEILGSIYGQKPEEFAQSVIEKCEELIENTILDFLVNHYWGNSLTSFISTRSNHPTLQVDFKIQIPIIGVGGAAKFFLPNVAKKLGTKVTFPENYEVGNAMGAALIAR